MRKLSTLDDRRQPVDPVIVTTESRLERLIERAVRRALERTDMAIPDSDDLVDMKGILEVAGKEFKQSWMYRNGVKLGFGIKPSGGKLLFSKRKFLAYINGRYRVRPLSGGERRSSG